MPHLSITPCPVLSCSVLPLPLCESPDDDLPLIEDNPHEGLHPHPSGDGVDLRPALTETAIAGRPYDPEDAPRPPEARNKWTVKLKPIPEHYPQPNSQFSPHTAFRAQPDCNLAAPYEPPRPAPENPLADSVTSTTLSTHAADAVPRTRTQPVPLLEPSASPLATGRDSGGPPRPHAGYRHKPPR